MKYLNIIFIMSFLMLFSVAVTAVPPGMKVEFAGGDTGKVVFDGKSHADKGLKCEDCHPKIFEQKKGTAKITDADHKKGKKFCFTCHNGTKSFAPKKNCDACHEL